MTDPTRTLVNAALALLFVLIAAALAFGAEPRCQPGEVPDSTCTPGVVASTDEQDVCGVVDGLSYSKRHRQTPAGLKALIRKRYGAQAIPAEHEEIEHLIPLCAGGMDSVMNLWRQSGDGLWSYHVQDRMEAEVCRRICAGTLPLADGQALFVPDWRVGFCRVFPGDTDRCGR